MRSTINNIKILIYHINSLHSIFVCVICGLTINGMAKKFKGHFLPYLLAMKPNIGMLSTKVKLLRAGIQLACSDEIGPVSNIDVSFDRSARTAADAQPVIMPLHFICHRLV